MLFVCGVNENGSDGGESGGGESSESGRPIHAHSVLLMSRSTYFEDLLFPLLGKRSSYNDSSGSYATNDDPLEIEVPDERAVMLEVLHFIYTGHVRTTGGSGNAGADRDGGDEKTRRERLLLQIEWLRKCIEAASRYDVPRMRVLCESMCEQPLRELANPKYCISILEGLHRHGAIHLFEVCGCLCVVVVLFGGVAH